MTNRRQRHLNPASAGAILALDARYITGSANNTTVQTWNSRPIATVSASQATSGSRANYLDSTINGMPGLVFDGSDDFYDVSDLSMTANRTSIWAMVVGMCTSVVDLTEYGLFNSSGTSASNNRFSQRIVQVAQAFSGSFRRLDTDSNVTTTDNDDTNIPVVGIISSDFTNNVASSETNGGTATTVAFSSGGGSGPTTNPLVSRVGAASAILGRLNGKLGQVLFIPTLPSASLAKRLRHCAAYSFKITSA